MAVPPTRKIAARLTVSYAGFEGESAQLEQLYKTGLKGELIGPDLYRTKRQLTYWTHTPPAPWQTAAWVEEQRDTQRRNAFLRQIENRWVTTESSFVEMDWFDACGIRTFARWWAIGRCKSGSELTPRSNATRLLLQPAPGTARPSVRAWYGIACFSRRQKNRWTLRELSRHRS
jgi:hypothetical protein